MSREVLSRPPIGQTSAALKKIILSRDPGAAPVYAHYSSSKLQVIGFMSFWMAEEYQNNLYSNPISANLQLRTG